MVELLQMWALVEVLGLMCLPLTITVFHNLPDRGWAFSKAIGMALLAFCVWLPLMIIQVLPFSQLFISGVLLILVACSIIGFIRVWPTFTKLVRANLFYIVICEAIFLGKVFFQRLCAARISRPMTCGSLAIPSTTIITLTLRLQRLQNSWGKHPRSPLIPASVFSLA